MEAKISLAQLPTWYLCKNPIKQIFLSDNLVVEDYLNSEQSQFFKYLNFIQNSDQCSGQSKQSEFPS